MSLRQNLIILCLIFCVFQLKVLEINGTPASLTDQKRAEIEKIRSELGEALQNYEDEEIAEKNVVVQPGWTIQADGKFKADGHVLATPQSLSETEALRAEIKKAILADKYVNKFARTEAGNSKNIKKLHEKFSKSMHSEKILRNMLTGAQHEENSDQGEIVGGAAEELSASSKGPNIVDSHAFLEADIDIEKLQYLEFSKRRSKEVLILESVEEDYSFNLGEDVQEWKFIMHNREEYFIGRRATDLLIVKKNAATYEKAKILNITGSICYLETYSFWNQKLEIQEGVILVASGKRIAWYRTDSDTKQDIILSWEWIVGNPISGLTYFSYESNDYLAISSTASAKSGYYALNIYQFDLHLKEFWMVQRLQLQYPCNEVTILDTGRDLVLAIPQNNTAAIYTFNNHGEITDFIRFQFLLGVESEDVGLISAFQMGGHSYLAIGGRRPQILLYNQGTFEPKTILGENFGLVEFYFPIPVRTYRDDLILLIQHRVDFETHQLTVLETLIWDGEAFEASVPVPCRLGSHTMYGVSCMLDLQRPEGLRGAALLRRDDDVSIIVPRKNVESGLFQLKTKLLAKNSEMLDLQEIFKFLQNWVKEQDELIEQAEDFIKTELSSTALLEADVSELSSLTAPEVYFNGSIGEIFINGYKWTDADTATDLNTIINAMEHLEGDLYSGRYRRDLSEDFHFDTLTIANVDVEELLIDELNNVPFYIQDGELSFNGTVNLQNLIVLEESTSRRRRQIQEQDLQINEDLIFSKINGVPWQEIKENIVLRNSPLSFDKLIVRGDIIIEDDLMVNELNNLSFPDDYLWCNEPTTSIIKAEKKFMGKFSVNAIDTMQGLINGVDPMRAITLMGPQEWTGTPTFRQLEVTEKLQLNGTIQSSNTKELPNNPTLEESHFITANCNFESLEVRGPIFLKGNLDKINLAEFLLDIAQKPSNPTESVLITSAKNFSLIRFPDDFHLNSSAINNLPITEFIPKHTRQLLNRTQLDAFVFFNNLTLTGTYDGIKIEDLIQNAIKINQTQISPGTQLNFVHDIQADNVNIKTSLNKYPIAAYQTIESDLVIPEAYFTELHAVTTNIPNNIMGDAKLNEVNLHEFMKNRDWSNSTTTLGNIFVDELILSDGLTADELHGLEPEFLFQFLEQIDDIPAMILDGKILVDKVIVSGNVQINKLNGLNFDEDIQLRAIWLNRQNHLNNNITFLQPIHIESDLNIMGNLNGQNLPRLIDDMVFRDRNDTIVITAKKIFKNDVYILEQSTVDAINGIKFRDIAKKNSVNNFKGSLKLNGNLKTVKAKFNNFFNHFNMSKLTTILKFDALQRAFIIMGNSTISNRMQLEDLTVFGSIYDIPKFGEFLEDLVFEDKVYLNGSYTFTGRVLIDGDAFIGQFNEFNLPNMLNNMVLVSDTKQVNNIDTSVKFMSSIKGANFIVREALLASNLQGNSIKDWLEDTLNVNKPAEVPVELIFTNGCLEHNILEVDTLNGIDMSQVITLHTPQNLSNDYIFSELYLDGQIITNDLINNIDIQHEYNNTLLIYGNQHITTPLTLPTAEVLVNLQVNAPVNGDKRLQHIATLQGVQVLQTPLYFQEVSAREVLTDHQISGININNWFENALWLNERPQQIISGNWSARKLLTKNLPQLPIFLIDGLSNTPQYERTVRSAHQYENLWHRFKHIKQQIATKNKTMTQWLNNIEPAFELVLMNATENIKKLSILNNAHINLLIATAHNVTTFYDLNTTKQKLKLLHSLPTEVLGSILLVPNTNKKSYLLIQNTTTLDLYVIHGQSISYKHSFNLNITSMIHAALNPELVYVINNQGIYEISADNQHLSKLIEFPYSAHSTYRFLPNIDQHNVKVCNNTHLLSYDCMLKKPTQVASHSLPLNYRRIAAKHLNADAKESTLHYDGKIASNNLLLPEFHNIIERKLIDLIYYLQLEVNITQLSIPESDLLDEHLAPDFNTIMQELKKQQIYAKDTFADIHRTVLQLPANPAQILAAHSVQIIWPFIVDIKEVQDFMHDKKELLTIQPICQHMIEVLGKAVRQTLLAAYTTTDDESKHDDYKTLMIVIQHLRDLEIRLKEVRQQLYIILAHEMGFSASEINDLENQSVELDASIAKQSENISVTYMENSQLLCAEHNEILELRVGSFYATRRLLVTANKRYDNLRLYMDGLNGSDIFQEIGAHMPHSLTTLYAGNETLLAFVETCCTVRIMSYRGVEGFVDFVTFDTDADINNLLSFKNEHYYIAAVLPREVLLYRVVFQN